MSGFEDLFGIVTMSKDIDDSDEDDDSFDEPVFDQPVEKIDQLEDKKRQLEKRRKIEELLERRRLKEEYGIEDIDF